MSTPQFIPGLTGTFALNMVHNKACTLTLHRETTTDRGVWLFTVTDFKLQTHLVKLTLNKPVMEEFSDLVCTCTCPDNSLLCEYGAFCDHVMVTFGEVMDLEKEGFDIAKLAWAKHNPLNQVEEWKGNHPAVTQVRKRQRLQNPELTMNRLMELMEEGKVDPALVDLLFPQTGEENDN
ncbi:hypothetical protein BASA81_006161 [Batrachochytrium salamandrivorans]|nr:hypothetical protein BASA81_006161 [Batrachochytrium salamandrivorans]